MQIDPDYLPAATEHKDVFGITFEQGRNDLVIDKDMLTNIVSENKDLPENAKIDMIVALITLKYTQSNSVCYVKDGQAPSAVATWRSLQTARGRGYRHSPQ